MSDLKSKEKWTLESLLGMSGGYVLDFSNRTFQEFVREEIGRDIYDKKYVRGSGSKANMLRGFWEEEPNHVVARLLRSLVAYGHEWNLFKNDPPERLAAVEKIIARLESTETVADKEAIGELAGEADFEQVAQEIKAAIDQNRLELGLDRLHTLTTKLLRGVCAKRGLDTPKDKPLHSLIGEYVKLLKRHGQLETVMAERILKSSISTLEAFNDVRNDRSLAHDNPLLTYDESLLIFNHVVSLVRYVRQKEKAVERIESEAAAKVPADEGDFDDGIPF